MDSLIAAKNRRKSKQIRDFATIVGYHVPIEQSLVSNVSASNIAVSSVSSSIANNKNISPNDNTSILPESSILTQNLNPILNSPTHINTDILSLSSPSSPLDFSSDDDLNSDSTLDLEFTPLNDLSVEPCQDEIISNLLIDYQMTSKAPEASMEKLLKLSNTIAELRGFKGNLVPSSYYSLVKNISHTSPGMQFICEGKEGLICGRLTKVIHRQVSKKYDLIECVCGNVIDPIQAINGKTGYFVKLDPIRRIRQILEILSIESKITYCNESDFDDNDNFGKFSSGRIYRNYMKTGDLSLTWFADGVDLFGSSSKDIWPALLMINELPPSLRKKYVIPAVIFFGPHKPDAQYMMQCIQDDLKSMALDGINWVYRDTDKVYLKNTKASN